MATRKRKATSRKSPRRKVLRTVRKRKVSSKRKRRVKRKRSLNTCSGSGYYLKVSKNGRILSIAGRGLRCKCPSSSRAKCKRK